jgi:hypothetical protein
VLSQKDETKNKKKITETEIDTKTGELFSDFQTVLASEQEDVAIIPCPFGRRAQGKIIFGAPIWRQGVRYFYRHPADQVSNKTTWFCDSGRFRL